MPGKRASGRWGPGAARDVSRIEWKTAKPCALQVLDISRATLAQIESRLRYVTDEELFILASLLEVSTDDLYPREMKKRRRHRRG